MAVERRPMKKAVILLALLTTCWPAQDSKPAKKPEAAPAQKPVEMTVAGRKTSLAVPSDWTETKTPSSWPRDDWKLVRGWEHPRIKGVSLRVYGVEVKDVAPAPMAQKWLGAAAKAKPALIVTVAGKNKTLKGLDTEVEMDENGSYSFYWMRAIAVPPKDKMILILAEAAPLDREKLETIVLDLRPILDSVLDPTGKDPWRRDPAVTVTCGELVTHLTVPATWEYTRLAPEGSLIWMGPESRQEIVLAFPLRNLRLKAEEALMSQAAPMVYKTMLDAETMIAEKLGKVVSKTPVIGHDQATDIVTVTDIPEVGPLWNRRRVFLDGSNLASVLGKHPLPNLDALPPEAAQKQVQAVFDSIKVEIVRGK
jgi:hypothetical protein